jgi:hypothetical protein
MSILLTIEANNVVESAQMPVVLFRESGPRLTEAEAIKHSPCKFASKHNPA